MYSIRGLHQRLCDRLARRDFLRVGALGGMGLSLPMLLQARAASVAGGSSFGRAKRCLLLFLTGGPSQLDTFDLKPEAPENIRGEFKPIATQVPGIQIAELLPKLATQVDKLCLVRSVTHRDTVHTSAGYTMLTGVPHPAANAPGGASTVKPAPTDHPHLGSLLAQVRAARRGMPTFVALPEIIKDAAVNEFPGQGGGFLGATFDPFYVEADTAQQGFRLPDLVLPADVTAARLDDRRLLRDRLAENIKVVERRGVVADVDGFYQQAFGLLASPQAQRAFQLDDEPRRLREAYGSHLFGRGCLLARRLLEAGVAMVTVYWHYEGPDDSPVWDTHQNIFPHLRNRLLPPTDQAVSTLLEDLGVRGLLDDTLVLCLGEFGRSPRMSHAGRDHWPHAQSILLAGAGLPGGSVYGATDRSGAYPTQHPVAPADLAATILHLLGVDPAVELHDALGRPHRASTGRVLRELIG